MDTPAEKIGTWCPWCEYDCEGVLIDKSLDTRSDTIFSKAVYECICVPCQRKFRFCIEESHLEFYCDENGEEIEYMADPREE